MTKLNPTATRLTDASDASAVPGAVSLVDAPLTAAGSVTTFRPTARPPVRRWLRALDSADDRPVRDLEVIVPAYNEAARLPATLAALQNHLSDLPLDVAIVVVDNGSVDHTAATVSRVQGAVPMYVLGCADKGKGAAVRRGITTSKAMWVGFQDADLSTPLSALRPVLAALADGADVAIAVRRGEGADDGDRSLSRRLGSAVFAFLATPLTRVEDSQCGFKFFRKDAAHQLFTRARVDGFAFDVEILALARRLQMRVDEVPVAWTPADGSTFRPLQDGVRSFVEVAKVRRILASSK